MSGKKKIKPTEYDMIIIDGLNFAFRYYYKFIMFSHNGVKTGMPHGVINQVLAFEKQYKSARIIFVWDSPNLRKKEMSNSYKADRKKKPDDIYKSIEVTKKLLSLIGITQYYCYGLEADDLSARLCKKHSPKKKILTVTQDADWYQIMNKNVDQYKHHGIMTEADALAEIKLSNMKEYVLFLCIVGTHNNVKGVPGIGDKKYDYVRELISGHTNIKKFLKSIKDNDNKVAQMIYKERKTVEGNIQLVTPILEDYTPEKIEKIHDNKMLRSELRKLGLKSLTKKLLGDCI